MTKSVTSSGHDRERLEAYLPGRGDAPANEADRSAAAPSAQDTASIKGPVEDVAADEFAPEIAMQPEETQPVEIIYDSAEQHPRIVQEGLRARSLENEPRGLAGRLARYLPVWRSILALQEQIHAQSDLMREQSTKIQALQAQLADAREQHNALSSEFRTGERLAGRSADDRGLMDHWYQDLQDLHRGSQEHLLRSQQSYVHHFNERASELRLAGPIMDLGCGRGEWLSLMSKEGWAVRGVDSSEPAVREASANGLDVELGDLVEVLQACPENALAGVTAFQVVEHLPFSRITALMHAAFRALVPGGILLLETPNPENLQVASYGFWMDPTHRHPIPPPLIMDLSFHVGFRDGSILRSNPWPQWQEGETESALEREVGYRLFGPQDYALLVFKPALAD